MSKMKNKLTWSELQERVIQVKRSQEQNLGVNISVIGFKIRKKTP